MKMKKYEFTGETITIGERTLHRIRAVRDFGDVKAGDIGGWIEKEENLSHEGYCWVRDEAIVYGSALVCDNATVCDDAIVCDEATVCDAAIVCDEATVRGAAIVCDEATVRSAALVCDNATCVILR